MSRGRWASSWLLGAFCATGCGGSGEQDIAARQEAAAAAAASALSLTLVATELVSHTVDEPTTTATTLRHDGTCGCPCSDRVGTDDSFVQELDYEQPSCVPITGLLPGRIGGHVWLNYDDGTVEANRSEAWVGDEGEPIVLAIEGTFSGQRPLWDAELTGELSVGEQAVGFEGTSIAAGTSLQLDGGLTSGELSGTFDRLVLSHQPAFDPCPLAVDGTVRFGDVAVRWEGEQILVDIGGDEASFAACELSLDLGDIDD